MQKQIIIALLSFSQLIASGQDSSLPTERCTIVTDNNKKIKEAQLWKIDTRHVEYEQNGSLHDVSVSQIKIIKLNDEVVSFDIKGQMEIRPYDEIISGTDTIQCTITRINVGNIYFYKKRGYKRPDYIPQHIVDAYYLHPDTVVFHSFKEKYFEYAEEKEALKPEIDTMQFETPDEIVQRVLVEEEEVPYSEYESQRTLKSPSGGTVIGQVLAGTAMGAVGTAAGAIGGATVLGLAGLIAGPTGALVGVAIGAGAGGLAGFGLGTGYGVYLVGNNTEAVGKFGSAVGGAYFGLLGSGAILLIACGTGLGVALAVAAPAVFSTISFSRSRKLKVEQLTSFFINNKFKSPA